MEGEAMGYTINAGDNCVVIRDIDIGGELAFASGEQVLVEKIDPNASRPEYRYVVFSRSLGKRFQLSEGDISPVGQMAVAADARPEAAALVPRASGKGGKTRTIVIVVGLVALLVAGGITAWFLLKGTPHRTFPLENRSANGASVRDMALEWEDGAYGLTGTVTSSEDGELEIFLEITTVMGKVNDTVTVNVQAGISSRIEEPVDVDSDVNDCVLSDMEFKAVEAAKDEDGEDGGGSFIAQMAGLDLSLVIPAGGGKAGEIQGFVTAAEEAMATEFGPLNLGALTATNSDPVQTVNCGELQLELVFDDGTRVMAESSHTYVSYITDTLYKEAGHEGELIRVGLSLGEDLARGTTLGPGESRTDYFTIEVESLDGLKEVYVSSSLGGEPVLMTKQP